MPRRTHRETTFQENLAAWTQKLRETIDLTPPGDEREALLKKVAQAENALGLAASMQTNTAGA